MKKALYVLVAILLIGCASVEKQERGSFFIPPLPQSPKLQFLMSLNDEIDIGVKQGGMSKYLYGEAAAKKRLARPVGIASSKGKIYVTDKTQKATIIIDLENKKFDHLMDKNYVVAQTPFGIWVTEDDHKYITDLGGRLVLAYDSGNNYIQSYGNAEILEKPTGVAVYGDKVYVADQKKNKVLVFDKDSGDIVQEIGGDRASSEDGSFYRPSHITVDKDGQLFVTDSFNFRIQIFDPEGNFIKSIGQAGDRIGNFARPKGIAIDREDHLYAVDAAFENTQIFDINSTDLLLFFGGYQTGPGSMYLPNSIHIDYENEEYFSQYIDKNFDVEYLVYVGNTLGHRKINVFAFGEWTGPPPSEYRGGQQ